MALPEITATGNVAQDPQLGYGTQGTAYARFTIACNENKKGTDGKWETTSTTWLKVVVFGNDAEAVAGTIGKGQKVTVIGRLSQSEYEKDGTTRTSFEVKNARVLSEIGSLSGGNLSKNEQKPKTTFEQNDPWKTPTTDSEAPF